MLIDQSHGKTGCFGAEGMDSLDGLKAPEKSDVESFFDMAPPLKDRDQTSQKLQEFVDRIIRSSGK